MRPHVRRAGLALMLLALCLAGLPARAADSGAAAATKTLRYAFLIAETGFDPAQISDLYSRTVAAGIFEAPLRYEFLARPVRLRLATAASMPEVSADFKTFTFRIKPGIYFADDPAFNGKKRELVADDYVYAIKRHYDPQWKSANVYILESAKILGLSELRRASIADKKPFDYARAVEGLRLLDRYTFQIRLGESDPRFLNNFADGSFLGAVAHEVVEKYGDKIMAHPIGTGAWRLADWRRSSLIVLEKNPNFHDEFYDEQVPDDTPASIKAQVAKLQGCKLPMLDRIEISIIEEAQPRWLSFLNGQADLIDQVPADFAMIAMPNNQLAPNLAKQGIQMVRYARADIAFSYFAMENPVVGGYTPDKVALRRAISLAIDLDKEIRLVRRGQAIPAQSIVAPSVWGYEPEFKSEMSEFSRAKARALLDMYGYVDRDGDGWRDQPSGEPLLLTYATQPDQQSRQLIEQWQKNMDAIKIRIEFKAAKWPENLKASRAGKLMMWGVGWLSGTPDGDTFLALGYGPNKGQSNHSRFDLPAYNALYEKQTHLPDGPERLQVMLEAKKMLVAYMPYKLHVHRIFTDMAQPWVMGYQRNIFVRDFWKYIDIDAALLAGKH